MSKTKGRIESEFPRLTISGMLSPPFRPLSDEEKNSIIETIVNSKPNLVVVALGCPKQELWMYENSSRIDAPLIGIGAALPVFAGLEKRAPFWMQQYCLEWLFRLCNDPRRLLKRYTVTNTLFLIKLTQQYIRQNILRQVP